MRDDMDMKEILGGVPVEGLIVKGINALGIAERELGVAYHRNMDDGLADVLKRALQFLSSAHKICVDALAERDYKRGEE